ncbi:hypothetical protein BGY98DRAFT_923254 [Russula aff. rugulosa BPL654]|nr:hypothetical protein BGY98DRAFT_923254 [Russula aff. rugulosa BPL654]
MGTHGYLAYRYKGRYFVYYHHFDSDPGCLGVEALREIPRNVSKERFEQWARVTRENLEAQFEKTKDESRWSRSDYTTDKQPLNIDDIQWVYEIDFDNLIFHVNAQPMFRLDNLPPSKIFLKSISYDHFGHTALRENTPVQFRYDWRAPPPPPSPESLSTYNSCHNRSSTSSMHDLLCVPAALSSIESARTALVELLVTRCMAERGIGHRIRILESVPDRDHISKSMLRLALSPVNFAVGLPIPSLPCIPRRSSQDFIWIRKDVCLRITTHLDDKDNLRASIGDLVRHINTTQDSDGEVGTIYGIACSIFHCAVVRVDKDVEGTTSFAHTPALQFLPSFFARKISTPGIEAMSRLGCQASGVEFLATISDAYKLPRITHAGEELSIASSMTTKVPIEVWTRIGDFLTSPADLVNLASISPQALSAAADLARCPWVLEFRLVDVVGSVPPIPETTESTKDNDIGNFFYEMGRAKFTAVRGGHRVNVELGQYDEWSTIGRRRETTFEVETYLSGRITQKLYVLEMGDDAKDTGS